MRRLEAVSGFPFLRRFREEQALLDNLSSILSCSRADLEKKAGALVEQQKQLEKQLRSAQQAKASNLAQELLDSQSKVQEIPVIVKAVGDSGPEQLRLLADGLKESFQGVAVLGAAKEGKVSLLVYVAPEVISKGLHAGKLIKELAKQVGGGGGGRADLAQAGGREPEKLDDALKSAIELVQAQITS